MNKFLKRKSIVLQDLFSIQEAYANNHSSKQNRIDNELNDPIEKNFLLRHCIRLCLYSLYVKSFSNNPRKILLILQRIS